MAKNDEILELNIDDIFRKPQMKLKNMKLKNQDKNEAKSIKLPMNLFMIETNRR